MKKTVDIEECLVPTLNECGDIIYEYADMAYFEFTEERKAELFKEYPGCVFVQNNEIDV